MDVESLGRRVDELVRLGLPTEDEGPEGWYRRGSELAEWSGSGEVGALASTLLRAAVAAGHGPARVRLAVLLSGRLPDADDESHAEAIRLLGEAVAMGVPGARNMLGVTHWDRGDLDEAEAATNPQDRPVCVLIPADAWQLDPAVLPAE